MIRIFISNSTKDLATVRRIATRLDEGGLFTFLAAVDVQPGTDLIDWMRTSLIRSTHVLLAWSANTASSKWVQQEMQGGRSKAIVEGTKRCILICLDETPLPLKVKCMLSLDILGGEEQVVFHPRRAILPPREELGSAKRGWLRRLSGYNEAKAQVFAESQKLSGLHPRDVQNNVDDFYYSPHEECVFLAIIRSSGVHSILPLERKGVGCDGRM